MTGIIIRLSSNLFAPVVGIVISFLALQIFWSSLVGRWFKN